MMRRANRITSIAEWVLAIFLAYVFVFAGELKLLENRAMVQEFARIGIGQWFRCFAGVLEVSGGIGLLIPKPRFWAAIVISAVMAGTTIANPTLLRMFVFAPVTTVLMTLAMSGAWLRRPKAPDA